MLEIWSYSTPQSKIKTSHADKVRECIWPSKKFSVRACVCILGLLNSTSSTVRYDRLHENNKFREKEVAFTSHVS